MYNVKTFNLKSRDAVVCRSSTGWLMKWNIGNYWIKAPGYVVSYTWDSVAEVLASEIFIDLGIKNCVEYRLCIINLDNKVKLIGCISKDYKTAGLNEVTLKKLADNRIISSNYYGYTGYRQLIKEIKTKFDLDITRYLEDTIIIDSIILNTDRNLWNMSIMLDKELNGHISPIYDFGNSLGLTGGIQGNFYEEAMYSTGIQARPFSMEFEEQLCYIRNNRNYSGELIRTHNMLDYLYNNFTVENNTYNVTNPIPLDVLNYATQVINKRYNTVIEGKIWKN